MRFFSNQGTVTHASVCLQAVASVIICLATIGLSVTAIGMAVANLLEADSADDLVAIRPWAVLPIPLGVYVALPATQSFVATWIPSSRLCTVICSGAVELVVVVVSVCCVLCVPAAVVYTTAHE